MGLLIQEGAQCGEISHAQRIHGVADALPLELL